MVRPCEHNYSVRLYTIINNKRSVLDFSVFFLEDRIEASKAPRGWGVGRGVIFTTVCIFRVSISGYKPSTLGSSGSLTTPNLIF